MEILLIIGILALNFGISWWNAKVAGMAWVEARALGGFMRLVVWSAAIQSAIGFSSVFVFLLGGAAYGMGYLPPEAFQFVISLWYLSIIIPAIGTGLIIMIHSWIVAYRERSLASMGTAAWNTFANAYNIYGAVDGVGKAFDSVTGAFEAVLDNDNNGAAGKAFILGVIIVVLALAGGILLTSVIIKRNAGTLPFPNREPQHVRS